MIELKRKLYYKGDVMIKHLFSDLDGTLLNNNGKLSDYTKKNNWSMQYTVNFSFCEIAPKNGKYFK